MLYALIGNDILGFDNGTGKYTITDNLFPFCVNDFEQLKEVKDFCAGEYCFVSLSYPFEFKQSKESDEFLNQIMNSAAGCHKFSLTFLATVIFKIVV